MNLRAQTSILSERAEEEPSVPFDETGDEVEGQGVD